MADDESSDGEGKKGKKDADKPKGKSNTVPAVVVAIGLIFAGKTLGGAKAAPSVSAMAASASAAGAELDCAVEDIKKPPKKGALFNIDAQPINLADGHYAKVGIALQLDSTIVLEAFTTDKESVKASAVLVSLVSGRDKAEFNSPQALQALQEKLTKEIRPKYECHVMGVLVTQFVIQ